jgi:ABC-type oligopeptide transport system substrate-binding subunit
MVRIVAPALTLLVVLALALYLDATPPRADLVLVNRNDAFTLDPQRMSWMQDLRFASALYEPLLRWDNTDFSIHPAAAALPEVSDDHRTYTFHLRHDGRWSNGDPVTAHDFIASWRRALLPDTAADYSGMFMLIEGGEAFFTWRMQRLAEFGADLPDDATLITPEVAQRVVGRLFHLLAQPALPEGIALPPALDREALQREMRRLLEAADRSRTSLISELEQSTRLLEVVAALDDESSRTVEAHWLWDQTMARFRDTVRVTAPDDFTLRVHLARPAPYFLDLVCFGAFHPVHRPTVEGWQLNASDLALANDRGWHMVVPPPFEARRWVTINPQTARFEQRHDWTKPPYHVGNGPYVLRTWRYKRDILLERNAQYHTPDFARCDRILAVVINDPNTAVLAFETGRFDWLTDVSAEYLPDMLAQRKAYEAAHAEDLRALLAGGMNIDEALSALPPPQEGQRRNIHVFPTFGTDFYSFNCRPTLSNGHANPFASAAVRRAFARSIDKQAIVDNVTRLHEPVANTFIPPHTIAGYESPEGLAYDLQAARRELAAAGWDDRDGDGLIEDERGNPFPVIDLLYSTNTSRYKWISLELKAQWEKTLGVRVQLRGKDSKFYKDDLIKGDFMIARGRWYGDYGDPTTFLNIFHTLDGNNDRKFSDPMIDEMLEDADRIVDPQARLALLSEIERLLFEEHMPLMPICQLVQVYMYEPGNVHGLSRHPRLSQFLWQIETESP